VDIKGLVLDRAVDGPPSCSHDAASPVLAQPLKRIEEADKDILLLSKQKPLTGLTVKPLTMLDSQLGAACDEISDISHLIYERIL
jgi:hypothetical protein